MEWDNGKNLVGIIIDLKMQNNGFLTVSVPNRFSKPRSVFTTVLPDTTILRNPIGAVKSWNAHKI